MPDPVSAIVGVGSQLISGSMAADAARDASEIQAGASSLGIAENRRQFDEMRRILEPYVQAGVGGVAGMQPYAAAGAPALAQQQALVGLLGPEAQQAAISQLESNPLFQSQLRLGEEAMLQNASATGGLRGGNMQAALAQFRPAMLTQEIERQYGRLGGLTALGLNTQQNLAQLGQASAARVGAAGLNTAANISGLLGQQGAAQAGGVLGSARAMQGILNLPMTALGLQAGAGGRFGTGIGGLFGGGSPQPSAPWTSGYDLMDASGPVELGGWMN